MPDYKEMYLTLFRANEIAIRTLIAAQRECEEQFLSAPEAPIQILRSDRGEEGPQEEK